jgi:hypothetical protein
MKDAAVLGDDAVENRKRRENPTKIVELAAGDEQEMESGILEAMQRVENSRIDSSVRCERVVIVDGQRAEPMGDSWHDYATVPRITA